MAKRDGAKIAVLAVAVLGVAIAVYFGVTSDAEDKADGIDFAAAPSPTPQPTAAPTPAASPTPAPTPEVFDRHAAVFRRSGRPAEQVLARFGDGHEEATGADGTFAKRGDSLSLDVVDIPTSLVLARFDAAPARARIELPEPVRIAGRVLDESGQPAAGASLRLGHGPRELAADRHRRRTHSQVMRAPNEDTPWGLEMPPSSSLWSDVDVASSGAFESPWFLAGEIPQLVAFDPRGRCAVVDVALPRDLVPRSVLGTDVRLSPPTGIEVEIDFPSDQPPFSVALGFLDAEIDADHAQEAALLLSAADAIDPGVARFAIGHGNVFVDRPGARLFAPLPPMRRAVLVARGATSALVPQREIEIPFGQVTYVRFERHEIFPTIARRSRFEGNLFLQGTAEPVAGATIVASWFGGKRETSTDAGGGFAFDALPADQELRFYLQAYDAADPPRWSHSRTEDLDGLSEDPTRVTWEIPGLYWMRVKGVPQMEGALPLVSLERSLDLRTWEPWRGTADFYFEGNAVEIEIPEPGFWRAIVQQSDFVFRRSDDVEFGKGVVEADARFSDADGVREKATIVVRRADGTAASGIAGFATPQRPGAQPVEVRANALGEIVIGPLNEDRVGLRIDGEREAFEGVVDVSGESAEVTLGDPK